MCSPSLQRLFFHQRRRRREETRTELQRAVAVHLDYGRYSTRRKALNRLPAIQLQEEAGLRLGTLRRIDQAHSRHGLCRIATKVRTVCGQIGKTDLAHDERE